MYEYLCMYVCMDDSGCMYVCMYPTHTHRDTSTTYMCMYMYVGTWKPHDDPKG